MLLAVRAAADVDGNADGSNECTAWTYVIFVPVGSGMGVNAALAFGARGESSASANAAAEYAESTDAPWYPCPWFECDVDIWLPCPLADERDGGRGMPPLDT